MAELSDAPDRFTKLDLIRWLSNQYRSENPETAEFFPESYLTASRSRQAFRDIADIVYCYSSSKNEPFLKTLERLEDAGRLFNLLPSRYIGDGTGQQHRDLWEHRDDLVDEFRRAGYRNKDGTFLQGYRPVNIAAELVERPWLDSRFMEWAIVDSLVCEEIRQFGRSILETWGQHQEEPLFLSARAYEKGLDVLLYGLEKSKILSSLSEAIIFILLFMALPLYGIWYGLANDALWAVIVGGIVFCYCQAALAYRIIRKILFWILNRKPPQTPLERNIELWNCMHDAYRELTGPVVDPSRVKKALETAAEKGAVWDGVVYAILNRVIARDPGAWVTTDSLSDREHPSREG